MEIKSTSKINIGLHIHNRRSDGFHNISTLFQEINLCDTVEIIEDKIFPKRNSFGGTVGAGMEDPIIFSKKLEVGMKTKSTENFLIIARLESLIAGLGMNETMMRAEKYINAGVDGIMIHSKLKEPSEVLEFIFFSK